MPIVVAAPPQRVPVFSGFDYVTVDEARHRVYAAHSASKRLLIVDAATGRVAAQVDVGPIKRSRKSIHLRGKSSPMWTYPAISMPSPMTRRTTASLPTRTEALRST